MEDRRYGRANSVTGNGSGVNESLFYESVTIGKAEVRLEFCPVRGGTFMMGRGDERHQVSLTTDFLLARYPVTQSQWKNVMGDSPSHFKGPDRPVDSVSWDDCLRFIERLNNATGVLRYRLPTEAEWEYACRAGSQSLYCFGDDDSRLSEYGWHAENSGGKSQAVGLKNPNGWGLFDMHGNVWEWCHDWFADLSSAPVTDPTGPDSGESRVLKGGSWCDDPWYLQSASRAERSPNSRFPVIGFRILREF